MGVRYQVGYAATTVMTDQDMELIRLAIVRDLGHALVMLTKGKKSKDRISYAEEDIGVLMTAIEELRDLII